MTYASWILLLALPSIVQASLWRRNNAGGKQPNFVYIITDDQDAATANPDIMPKTAKWFSSGSNYTSFYSPISVCCPSRVSFFTSQFAHNHNVTDVSAPYGGFGVYCANGRNGRHLPNWLQQEGYQTYYTGKFMNGNTVANAHLLPVQGFNGSDILLDPWTYVFYNASYSHNGQPAIQQPGRYSTDAIRDYGLGYLDTALKYPKKPFFIGIAPVAPHSQSNVANGAVTFDPPVPALRHANLFPSAKTPRPSSFNPDVASGVSWVQQLEKLNQTNLDYLDYYYQQRLRSLQAVDELVDAVFRKLEKAGLLENTYVIYTADNGFSIGEHRRQPSKGTGYEEDIRVPFLVRGPRVKKGNISATHSVPDISATITHLANAESPEELDGKVMPWGAQTASKKDMGTSHHQIAEFWVRAPLEGNYSRKLPLTGFSQIPASEASGFAYNNTYRTLRITEPGNDWMYSVWCTGQRELYNMSADSVQMNNLVASLNEDVNTAYFSSKASKALKIASRMDGLLLYLKTCKGIGCRTAWNHLFPYGEVTSMAQALDASYDAYFDRLPKVELQGCDNGYRLEQEFPYWTTDLPYFAPMDAPGVSKRDFIAASSMSLPD